MSPKIVFETPWSGGVIRVETTSIEELTSIIENLRKSSLPEGRSEPVHKLGLNHGGYPKIGHGLSCKGTIAEVLATPWGRMEPRTEAEITETMRVNLVYYPRGTISGVLAQMAKRGEIRKVGKKNGAFAYVLGNDASPSIVSATPGNIALKSPAS